MLATRGAPQKAVFDAPYLLDRHRDKALDSRYGGNSNLILRRHIHAIYIPRSKWPAKTITSLHEESRAKMTMHDFLLPGSEDLYTAL
jgi:hypothetical protein